MKIGDTVECAIWLSGEETPAMIARWNADCSYMMKRSAGLPILRLGPITFEIKYPGQDRVPPVPDHIQGPDVRLLVATATVVGLEIEATAISFLDDLDKDDLRRLREVTRRTHARANPRSPRLTDSLCDQIIEQLGPVAAAEVARHGVDGGLLH